jgi:hypothetical protein
MKGGEGMKKILALMAAIMMVAAFSGVTFAEEKKAEPAKEEKKAPEKVKQVTGEATAVDAKANTITVKGRKGEVTCDVTADTKIAAGKETKTLADVAAGNKVTVKYVEGGGKNVAKSIAVKAATKEEEKKEEKK